MIGYAEAIITAFLIFAIVDAAPDRFRIGISMQSELPHVLHDYR